MSPTTSRPALGVSLVTRDQIARIDQGKDYGSVTGAVTLDASVGTHVLDASGDVTLTLPAAPAWSFFTVICMSGGAGVTMAGVDAWPLGEPGAEATFVRNFQRVRGTWLGFAGGSGAVAAPVAVTPTAPTWTDSPDGGGMYTIPAKSGIKYMVATGTAAAVATPDGDYPVDPKVKITVTAVVTDENRFYLADGADSGWSHTFPASKYALITKVDFSQVPDTADASTVATSNGTKLSVLSGKARVVGGKLLNFYDGTSATRTATSVGFTPGTYRTRLTVGYELNGSTNLSSVITHASNSGNSGVVIRSQAEVVDAFDGSSVVAALGGAVPAAGTIIVELDSTAKTSTTWLNGTVVVQRTMPNMNSGTVFSASAGVSGDSGHPYGAITSLKLETF